MKSESVTRLANAGIQLGDAMELRRIAMTLRKWFEGECNGNIIRRESDNKPIWRPTGITIQDREKGAAKRLATIVQRYPGWQAYVQDDPRGAALFLLEPGKVKEGEKLDEIYSRGIAVYK